MWVFTVSFLSIVIIAIQLFPVMTVSNQISLLRNRNEASLNIISTQGFQGFQGGKSSVLSVVLIILHIVNLKSFLLSEGDPHYCSQYLDRRTGRAKFHKSKKNEVSGRTAQLMVSKAPDLSLSKNIKLLQKLVCDGISIQSFAIYKELFFNNDNQFATLVI